MGVVAGAASTFWTVGFLLGKAAQNTNSQPVTLRFARQVGGIMAEVGEDEEPKPSYRFYM